MSRESIFDIVRKKWDINTEIDKLLFLMKQTCIEDYSGDNVYDAANYEFKYWNNRGTFISVKNMADALELKLDPKMFIYLEKNIDIKKQLIYLEYISNVIYLSDKYIAESMGESTTNYALLKENLDIVLNHINYERKVLDEEEKVLLCEKNASATAVAEILSDETSYDIIEYNHFLLKGDIKKKKSVLLKIIDRYSEIDSRINNYSSSIHDDIGFLINNLNLRHNNKKRKR